MPTAKVLRTSTVECSEKHGAIVRLVTVSRVVGIVDTSLAALLTALGTAGIPAAGSGLAGFANLVLVSRDPQIVDDDPGTFDVTLTYEVISAETASGQSFDAPIDDVIVGEVRVDVQQVTTNLDGQGNQITVSHTFPTDDPDFPDGNLITQGGEVNVFIPQRTFTIRGIKNLARPWLLANSLIGRVNSTAWSGEGAREWLCTGATWKIHDRSGPNRYLMEFEFQHNAETWDPVVVFIDSRTSKPPPNLIEDVGFKKVIVLPEIPFESILGSRMQGA